MDNPGYVHNATCARPTVRKQTAGRALDTGYRDAMNSFQGVHCSASVLACP